MLIAGLEEVHFLKCTLSLSFGDDRCDFIRCGQLGQHLLHDGVVVLLNVARFHDVSQVEKGDLLACQTICACEFQELALQCEKPSV